MTFGRARIHALRIPFQIPVAPGKLIDRDVYSYIVFGDKITLVDSGVKGAEKTIFDYILKQGRDPQEISMAILTHSHPDHIGALMAIKEAVRCTVAVHAEEKNWTEDTDRQFSERPVPGFHALVGGPVAVDRTLTDGEVIDLEPNLKCEVLHTPGHSRGSISLLFASEKAVITGDCLPLPNNLPIYDDIAASVNSIKRLKKVEGVEKLLSSWEAPIEGPARIAQRMDGGFLYLRAIHQAVMKAKSQGKEDLMDLCRFVVNDLGLPPFAANPLVAKSFASNLAAMDAANLF